MWENKEKIKSRKLNQLTVYHVILGGKMWLIADASQKKQDLNKKGKGSTILITLEIIELMRMLGIRIKINQICIYLRTSITHKNGK